MDICSPSRFLLVAISILREGRKRKRQNIFSEAIHILRRGTSILKDENICLRPLKEERRLRRRLAFAPKVR
jgi:hypothetical protein